ncbi:MAG: GNAT family N-acetyltransferase [Eubacteriales bacterium]|nr:GNAT family N-acetyltransferase [Eubacteriales bacterium]MDD4476036.1 GNAT family N-acetyltransferase [Eubacteriales bacterium]
MPDMLVKLYDLGDYSDIYKKLADEGIRIIRPMTPNKTKVSDFVRKTFSDGWADEIETAFTRFPVSCFIAYDDNEKKIVGFAGYDCTFKDFFGPTGVDPNYRNKGIGSALLLRCFEAMRDEGYGYAIIGSAGPVEYYKKVCGAVVIENSSPGIYKELI